MSSQMESLQTSLQSLKVRTEALPTTQELLQSVTSELRQTLSGASSAINLGQGTSANIRRELQQMVDKGLHMEALTEVLERGNLPCSIGLLTFWTFPS